MTTATYPDDAQAPITAFSVVATSTFNNTGTTRVVLIYLVLLLVKEK